MSDRFERQADIVPEEKISQLDILVVGCGAVGSQIGLMLACMGAKQVCLVDFDRVELTNVVTQGFAESAVGQPKVQALSERMRACSSEMGIEIFDSKYDPAKHKMRMWDAVFCCVDDMEARKQVFQDLATDDRFWGDTRSLGEVSQIYTANTPEDRAKYATTLFAPEEAEEGRCTAQMTVSTAYLAAGLLMHQFNRWLRGYKCDSGLLLNLPASEMSPISFTPPTQPAESAAAEVPVEESQLAPAA